VRFVADGFLYPGLPFMVDMYEQIELNRKRLFGLWIRRSRV